MTEEEAVQEPEAEEAQEEAKAPVNAGPGAAAATSLKRGPRGTLFDNVNDALSYATACYRSGMLPDHIKSPQQAFVLMDNGAELGLRPWAAWKLIYITKQGRIATMSKGALAVVQASPNFEDYEERIELEGTEEMRAVAIAKRKGKKATIKFFSMADAKAAGLLKKKTNRRGEEYDGPWQSYVKDMILARARDRALSVAFAAELAGIELETMAEDGDRMEANAAGAPAAQTVQLPPGDIDMGEPPRQIAAGAPDPLLLHTLKGKATPAPEPVAVPTVREQVAEQASASARTLAEELDEKFAGTPPVKPPKAKRTRKKATPPKKKPELKVGDIIHGTRRVLEVDGEGRPTVVEKLSKEEIAELDAKTGDELKVPTHCPRENCGTPLNLMGDCDKCGWPSTQYK